MQLRAPFMTKRFDRELGEAKAHVKNYCAMRHYDFDEVRMYSCVFRSIHPVNIKTMPEITSPALRAPPPKMEWEKKASLAYSKNKKSPP